jgi:hypothetical protein
LAALASADFSLGVVLFQVEPSVLFVAVGLVLEEESFEKKFAASRLERRPSSLLSLVPSAATVLFVEEGLYPAKPPAPFAGPASSYPRRPPEASSDLRRLIGTIAPVAPGGVEAIVLESLRSFRW